MSLYTPNLNWLGPINRLHPLNRGLVSWWMIIPGLTGGPTWIDLADPSNGNHGTLTNMDTATDWVPSNRLGGWGALDLDGTNDWVDVAQKDIVGAFPITLCGWMRPNGTTRDYQIITISDKSFSAHYFQLGLLSGTPTWFYQPRSGEAGPETATLSGGAAPDLEWSFVCGVSKSQSDHELFVNGISAATSSQDISNYPVSTDQTSIGVLYRNGSPDTNLAIAQIDDVRAYKRALSASEALSLYQLSRQGYPGMLNRIEPRLFVAAAVGRTMGALAGHGGLAGPGGIAGRRGGIAA